MKKLLYGICACAVLIGALGCVDIQDRHKPRGRPSGPLRGTYYFSDSRPHHFSLPETGVAIMIAEFPLCEKLPKESFDAKGADRPYYEWLCDPADAGKFFTVGGLAYFYANETDSDIPADITVRNRYKGLVGVSRTWRAVVADQPDTKGWFEFLGKGDTQKNMYIDTDNSGNMYTLCLYKRKIENNTNMGLSTNSVDTKYLFLSKFDINGYCLWNIIIDMSTDIDSIGDYGFSIDLTGDINVLYEKHNPNYLINISSVLFAKYNPEGILTLGKNLKDFFKKETYLEGFSFDDEGNLLLLKTKDQVSEALVFDSNMQLLHSFEWNHEMPDAITHNPSGNFIFIEHHFGNYSVYTYFGNSISEVTPEGKILSSTEFMVNAEWIAFGLNGNMYGFGTFEGERDFLPGQGEKIETAEGGTDCFISKLDYDGKSVWAKTWGGKGFEYTTGLDIDEDGNAYVLGRYDSALVDFDPGPNKVTNEPGKVGSFISKFDSDGNFQWVRTWQKEINFNAIKCFEGGIFLAGWVSDIVDFDPGPGVASSAESLFTPPGSGAVGQNAFLLKLDSEGNYR